MKHCPGCQCNEPRHPMFYVKAPARWLSMADGLGEMDVDHFAETARTISDARAFAKLFRMMGLGAGIWKRTAQTGSSATYKHVEGELSDT